MEGMNCVKSVVCLGMKSPVLHTWPDSPFLTELHVDPPTSLPGQLAASRPYLTHEWSAPERGIFS